MNPRVDAPMKTISLRHAMFMFLFTLLLNFPLLKGEEKAGYPTMGTIERKDPRFDKLIPRDAVLEKLARFAEQIPRPIFFVLADPDVEVAANPRAGVQRGDFFVRRMVASWQHWNLPKVMVR